ncbi:NAD(P)/FAD-dependent oxidoreductase [uncultured Marivita sp.]|jgi:NADPH-dependent 2,4-dienoyl-CoA reductase/sulfur reductase-like enzyme|uniref:NAD(P)/FAD-dependent oxidoreductase n=1 Tax=Marivita sp. TaxID=2003365 RepID=UPI0025D20C5B|nr:NAD(P)/FAD-dependent oxidoreductase [uncultured Marivita sp.]MCR9111467.1 FAD-dependent oxidoreductase [Paracoccaceae bacterium]
MQTFDVAIVGAGPAGMSAAIEAADHGLRVALLDEQSSPGGQIYRGVNGVGAERAKLLGDDYAYGRTLTSRVLRGGLEYFHGAVVWSIENGFRISYTRDGKASGLTADRVVLATGALERPMPIPGWTLPGVMTAGAGQIFMKQSGIVAQNAVLVGTGPLLYLVAAQMIRFGAPPVALVETQTQADLIRAAKYAAGAVRGWRYLRKGLSLLAEIKRAGVPRYRAATRLLIEGTDRAQAVQFHSDGHEHRIACDTVFLHHGVVPNTQAARALRVPHAWDDAQACFVPKVDGWGMTDVDGLFIAGDSAGIGGARTAELAGRMTALRLADLAGRLTVPDRDHTAAPLRAALQTDRAVRPFLNAAYPPYTGALTPDDATIICRCEEVTAGDIRRYAQMGCEGPNQTKAFGRVGMGPCQGRYCGLSVTALLADAHRRPPDDIGYYRIRPPLKPVTLGELAAMPQPDPEGEI